MTKGLRITVYTAAALTLAALLVLLLMPAQARYLRTAQWQGPYPAVAAEFTSDFLALQGEPTILLADWSPSKGETKTVLLHLTCPAELLQMSTAEETAGTQETASMETEEPVKVTLGAVGEHYLKAETKTAQAVNDGDIAVITVTLTLTAETNEAEDAITEKTVEVPLSVSFAGKTFNGRLSLTLWPKADESSAEEKNLFNKTTSMKEYDSAQPFYVKYTLPEGCTSAQMTLDGNVNFPRGTRFSTNNGGSYSVLCEDRPIPVTGSQSLLVDMSEAGVKNVDRTLKLTATGEDGKPVADSLTLTAKSWSGGADVTYSEDGLPSMTILPWNSECLQLTAIVERLEWTKKTVQTSEQEPALQEMQRTVAYMDASNVIQIDWTSIKTAEVGGIESGEGESLTDTAETLIMTLLPAENISRAPAGTYRLRLCWKSGDILVVERVIPFFVTW